MDFELNSDQELIRKTFRDFVDKEVKPQADEIDERKEFPMELFRKVADLGFFGMRYPEDGGGSGTDAISYCLAVIELARGSLSLAAACTMQSLMATYFLYRFGGDELRKYFDQALKGEIFGAIVAFESS